MYQPFQLNFKNNVNQTQQIDFDDNEQNIDTKFKQPARWEILYQQAIESTQKKQKFITQYKEQSEQDLKDSCPFVPIISNKANDLLNNRDVIIRNEQWLKQKEYKINLQKIQDQKKELQNCSFKPQLEKYNSSNNITEYQKNQYMNRGTANFLQRQESARQMKIPEQKKQQKKTHVTVPKEFNLTKSNKQKNIQNVYQQSRIIQKQDKIQVQDLTDFEYKQAQLEIRNLIKKMDID